MSSTVAERVPLRQPWHFVPSSRQRVLLIVALVALVPRLWLVIPASTDEIFGNPDAEGYSNLALSLLHGYGFSFDTEPPYRPDSLRTPLYPVFVAGLYAISGQSPKAVTLAQVILDVVTALVVTSMVLRLGGMRAGASAGVIYALTPSQLLYAGQLLTESLLALLIALAFSCLIFVRRQYLLAGLLGALGALCIYCKPNAVPIPLIFAFAAALRTRSWLRIPAVVLTIVAVLILPWIVRNALVFGRPMISTAFENNIAHVSAVGTLNEVEHANALVWDDKWEELYTGILASTEVRYDFHFFLDRTWSPREADLHWQQVMWQSLEIIKAHPVETIAAHMAGTANVWWRAEEYRGWYTWLTGTDWPFPEVLKAVVGQDIRQGHLRTAVERLIDGIREIPFFAFVVWIGWHAVYLIGAVALAVGVWSLRSQPVFILAALATIVYLTLLPGPIGYERFRVPFVPLLAALEGIGLAALGPGRSSSGRRSVGAGVIHWHVNGRRLRR